MDLQLVSFIKCISILFLYGQYYYVHIEIQLIVRRNEMTITLKKNSVDVRVELRRNDTDFIGDDRAYYAYFFSKAGCFGSAKVTEKEIFPIDCESFTTKERENFKDALAPLQPDILKLASFLNKENENKGDLESTLDLQWALAKRGRPSLDDKPLIRTTILLTEEDKEKLKILGGSSWIRNQIRMARLGEIQ